MFYAPWYGTSCLNSHSLTMAVLKYCITVTLSATPISPDSANPAVPDPRQTKVNLPNKKAVKWSTGMAPGEYGGPPTSTKLRKYGGGEGEDPITSDEFIWNKDFMSRMNKLFDDSASPPQQPPVKIYLRSPMINLRS
ncbi:hypothetical protein CsatB_006776 [Cannabis sativa]